MVDIGFRGSPVRPRPTAPGDIFVVRGYETPILILFINKDMDGVGMGTLSECAIGRIAKEMLVYYVSIVFPLNPLTEVILK